MEEVHLWRGSPEQRALRLQTRKIGQFAYFDKQLDYPDWSDMTVLDFGGNIGDLLQDSEGAILPENYFCVDVLREAVAVGRKRFPGAHWIHYNRYNCSFNPTGVVGLPLSEMGTEFHAILAYSVFTHASLEDMHDLVEQLRQCLLPGGVLAFTFIDPHFIPQPESGRGSNLQWRLNRNCAKNPAIDVAKLLDQSRGAQWCTLVGDSTLFIDSNGSWADEPGGCLPYNVFHTVNFIEQQFPDATIHLPANGEMQHCCVISR